MKESINIKELIAIFRTSLVAAEENYREALRYDDHNEANVYFGRLRAYEDVIDTLELEMEGD